MKHLLINKYFARNIFWKLMQFCVGGKSSAFFTFSNIKCINLSLMINNGFKVSVTGQHEIKWLWIYMSKRHSIDQKLYNLNLQEGLPMICYITGLCWLWCKKYENSISNSNRTRVLQLHVCNYMQVLVNLTTREHSKTVCAKSQKRYFCKKNHCRAVIAECA